MRSGCAGRPATSASRRGVLGHPGEAHLMRTIHKFLIPITDQQTVPLQPDAIIRSAQVQHDVLCLWAEIPDTRLFPEQRTIWIFGTGHPMPEAELRFIDTVQMLDGALVWHVYEGVAS